MGLTSWDTAGDTKASPRQRWSESEDFEGPEATMPEEGGDAYNSDLLQEWDSTVNSYTEAVAFLESHLQQMMDEGRAGFNKFEKFCIAEGILPTEAELDEGAGYDWFMALFYNQPELLKKVDSDLVHAVLSSALLAAGESGNEAMRDLVIDTLAEYVTGKVNVKGKEVDAQPEV